MTTRWERQARTVWVAALVVGIAACSSGSTPTTSSDTGPSNDPQAFVRWAENVDSALVTDTLDDVTTAADTGDPVEMIRTCADGVDAMDAAADAWIPTPDDELTVILGDAFASLREGFSRCAAGDFTGRSVAALREGGELFVDATTRVEELQDEYGM